MWLLYKADCPWWALAGFLSHAVVGKFFKLGLLVSRASKDHADMDITPTGIMHVEGFFSVQHLLSISDNDWPCSRLCNFITSSLWRNLIRLLWCTYNLCNILHNVIVMAQSNTVAVVHIQSLCCFTYYFKKWLLARTTDVTASRTNARTSKRTTAPCSHAPARRYPSSPEYTLQLLHSTPP